MTTKPEELDRLLDVRVRERYLKEGNVSPEQVKAYLDGLPDSADDAEFFDLPKIGPEEEEETSDEEPPASPQ